MINVAQNYPNYKTSGYAIMDFFSKKFNKRYWETDAIPLITTSQYFSELKEGDTVNVTNEPTITVHTDYADGGDLEVDPVTLDGVQLKIDKSIYFNVPLTDVQKNLSHLDLTSQFLETAMKEVKKSLNTTFFASVVADAAAANTGATAGALFGGYNLGATAGAPVGVNPAGSNSATSVIEYLTQFQAVLREQYANQDTWLVIPPWMEWTLINSDMKSSLVMGDGPSRLIDGYRGKLNNMNVIVSGFVPGTGVDSTHGTAIIGGNKEAIGFTMKNIRTQQWYNGKFQTLLQSLNIWGYKTVKPQGLVVGYAYRKANA